MHKCRNLCVLFKEWLIKWAPTLAPPGDPSQISHHGETTLNSMLIIPWLKKNAVCIMCHFAWILDVPQVASFHSLATHSYVHHVLRLIHVDFHNYFFFFKNFCRYSIGSIYCNLLFIPCWWVFRLVPLWTCCMKTRTLLFLLKQIHFVLISVFMEAGGLDCPLQTSKRTGRG
jgi:hypothetical protein